MQDEEKRDYGERAAALVSIHQSRRAAGGLQCKEVMRGLYILSSRIMRGATEEVHIHL